jgi:hypothetical protein
MDNANYHWDLGFEAGVKSQAMVIADLTKKLDALTAGAPLILQADMDVLNNRIAFLKNVVSDQSNTIIKLVKERDNALAR